MPNPSPNPNANANPNQAVLARHVGVGIAGAKVVDEQGRILHAGLDVALGEPAADRLYEPDALASTWHGHARSHSRHDHGYGHGGYGGYGGYGYGGYGHGYGGYGYGGTWRERDTAVPVHRWQGLLAEPTADSNPTGADEGEGAEGEGGASASLTGGERVLGVALAASAVRTALWRALGGLNESMPPDHAALDLSLRARQLGGHATVYVNASVVVQRSRPEGDPTTAAEESGLASLFEARWGSELEARIAARWRVALPLVWSMECGTGQVHGFTDEAITFALALERHVDLRLEISEMWRCRDTVLGSLPADRWLGLGSGLG